MSVTAGSPGVDLKVVLLGKHYVGKTALMERFLHERYLSEDGYQTTIGAAYGSRRVQTQACGSIVMGVWDTAGQEQFECLTRMYYRGAAAGIVCYDVTDPDSLARAQFWAGELAKFEPQCRLYVCGCKVDLAAADPSARRVAPSAVRQFANGIAATFVETSSKTGENVAELFATIAEDFCRSRPGGSAGSAFPLRQQPSGQRAGQAKKDCSC